MYYHRPDIFGGDFTFCFEGHDVWQLPEEENNRHPYALYGVPALAAGERPGKEEDVG